jgi:cyclohexyl-isocyanide hydratase
VLEAEARRAYPSGMSFHIGMLLYPGLTQLDLTGPFEVLSRLPGSTVHLAWKDTAPVRSDSGLGLLPTVRFADCPPLDLLFVPGGGGQIPLMEDAETLGFLAAQGARARWVTSVCTGSLLLGAAGLLRGYAAATHWAFMPLLARFGARPVEERVVVDRNRITAGGVTAGIDFGFRVFAEVAGEDAAKRVELFLEYDPAPPFGCGHPRRAPAEVVDAVRQQLAERYATRLAQIDRLTTRER